jgi:serine phosphatase RsbU (regulator of sigma subunit)
LKEEATLAKVPLFASLPADELEKLASSLSLIEIPAGTVLIHEGECGHSFFVIKHGQVEAVKDLGTTNEKVLNRMGPGDYLGEMSLLSHDGLRNASIRAVSQASLWQMTQADFDALLQRQPSSGYELLKDLSQRLDSSQNDIIDDLKMSLLPAELPELAGFDFGANIQPARQVGGDLYDFIPIEKNRVGVLIGDVTDKGVPAAIFMAQVQAFLLAEAKRYETPSEVLAAVNRLLLQKNEERYFVTVLYGVLDRESATYTYARAGHELPILYQSNGEARLMPLTSGQPLGIFEDPFLDENVVTIPPGGGLILYTDGITDERDHQQLPFGEDRLLQAVWGNGGLSAQELCDHILQTVMEFGGDEPQVDDLTLAVVKAK